MFRRCRNVALLLALALFGVASLVLAADIDWRDVESRMQYAWYTEDARDLAAVADRVSAAAGRRSAAQLLPGTDPVARGAAGVGQPGSADAATAAGARARGLYQFR